MEEQSKEGSCTMNKILIIDDDKELCVLLNEVFYRKIFQRLSKEP